MSIRMECAALFAAAAMALACGGQDPLDDASGILRAASQSRTDKNYYYAVGGSVSGLSSASTVVLQDNGANDVVKTGDGSFTFVTPLKNHSTYAVTVHTQPSDETCTVANGTGTIAGANVASVAVTCSASSSMSTYTVGGTISELSSTVVLQDNGGDDLTATAEGSFTFATPLADGSTYDVMVSVQPANQLCGVANGTGTIGGANVTDVTVACQPAPSGFYSGYCIVDPSTSRLTGECMDLDTCAIGAAPYYCSGMVNPPPIDAYCGPKLDYSRCLF